MKNLYKFFFLVIVLFGVLQPHAAKATHVMGSDITWKCLGGDTFLVTVTAYRDCNGIPLSGTDLGFSTDEGCVSGRVSAGGTKCCGKDITPVCQKSCTRCTDLSCDFQFGIEQWTITAKIVLPSGCCHYKFSWTECCRNGAITTGAAGQNFYSEVECNRCIKNPCDNSPYFTNPPVGIFCVNQCVVYNPGANDDDRDVNGNADSLAYSFGDPLGGAGSPLSYNSPYSAKTPLVYTGTDPDATFTPPLCAGFHLDPQTGDIQFRATKTDVTVMVQVIDEYRKDSLGVERKIGTIRRDLQISIIDCPENHAPVITGINGGTTTSLKICADQQTCFTIKAFDIDPKDTVKISWNNQIAGATFKVTDLSKKWPTGTFCWRPKKSDVRSYPYRFIVTALDNACPVPGRASRSFSIYVIASPEAVYSAKVQNCGVVKFTADVSSSSPTAISDYVWVGEGAPGYGPLYIHSKTGTYQYTRPGTYHYTLAVTGPNGCTSNYEDSVKIPQFVEVSLPKDTVVCEKSLPITIQATPMFATKPFTLTWDNSSNTKDQLTAKVIRDTVFVVHIKDATGCTNYDSMKVKLQPLPKPNIGPDKRGCWGHTVTLTTGLKKKMPYVSWTKIQGKDTIKNYLSGDTVAVADSGIYVVNVRDSFTCAGADSVNVFFNPLVKANNIDTNVCINDSVRLVGGIAGADATFKWIDVVHQKVISTARTYTIPIATNTIGGYHYQVVINQTRNGVTCIDTGNVNVTVHKKPTPQLKPLPDKCIDDNAFSLTAYVDVAHKGGYWFYPKNPSAIVSDYLYPNVMGVTNTDPTLGYVHYIYTDAFKCVSNDSVKINIGTLPKVSAGHDTEICTAAGRYILSNGYVAPSGGTWIPAPATTKSAATPKSAIQYSNFRDTVYFDPSQVPVDSVYGVIYKVTSNQGKAVCNNSDTVYIRVKTNPVITISKIDSLCDIAEPVQLSANPGGGIWSFADATPKAALTYDGNTASYFFDPTKAGGGSHRLYYLAYGDQQRKMCSTIDSTDIYVIPSPPATFNTEDGLREYCVDHGVVKLVPNKNWIGGSFSGSRPGMVYMTGGQGYFDPSKADTLDSTKNVITYNVPYDNGKCVKRIVRTVGVDARPYVHITSNPVLCEGQSTFTFTASVNNVTNLKWRFPFGDPNQEGPGTVNGKNASINYQPTQQQRKAKTFSVVLEGSNNGKCSGYKDSITVSISPLPKPVYAADDTVGCEPLRTVFSNSTTSPATGVQVIEYTWDFGDGTKFTGKVPPAHIYTVTNGKDSQVYDVSLTAKTNFGCSYDSVKKGYITVYATPKPVITANPQFTTIAVPDIQFDVDPIASRNVNTKSPNTQYYWSFGDSTNDHPVIRNPKHTYKDTGTFKVHLMVTSNGCTGIDSEDVYIKPELIIFIPNVFKPDGKHGDGKKHGDNYFKASVNNTFQPVISNYATFEMTVFNRWGEQMYSTLTPDKGWDGKYKGHDPVQDVYVYVIKATSFSGRPYTFTGTVTLLY